MAKLEIVVEQYSALNGPVDSFAGVALNDTFCGNRRCSQVSPICVVYFPRARGESSRMRQDPGRRWIENLGSREDVEEGINGAGRDCVR
jgi:hypothetical protein